MTLTLTPDLENAIAEQARREGTTPEQVALDGLRSLYHSSQNNGNVDLKASGIDEAQAAQLRARLSAFAEEWDSPDMEVYNNYQVKSFQGRP